MMPIRSNRSDPLSWKLVDRPTLNAGKSTNPPPCPVHSSWPGKTSSINVNSSSTRNVVSSSVSSSSRSDYSSEKETPSSYGVTSSDYMEVRVFIRLAKGQGLGCSVVKGPTSYPGIFVTTIKEGGIAQESGLEVGDQIIGLNGISLEPGDMEFHDAINRIKSCSQMTLTVRKKSGLSLFIQQQSPTYSNANSPTKQQVRAIVHSQSLISPPVLTSTCNGEKVSRDILMYHSTLSSKPSSESSSSNFFTINSNHHLHHHQNHDSRFYTPSEHDYSLSEVESNGHDMTMNLSKDPITTPNSNDRDQGCDAQKIYDQVRRKEERLTEEKRKLESQQQRLQEELEKLERERKRLENLRPQEDCKSLSSASTESGSGTQSISSSGSGSQMGFLDEIKKLAERRTNENGLITDTLNKTRNQRKICSKVPKTLANGEDDETRKRHELLMEEFRAAHSRMFGHGNGNGSRGKAYSDETTKVNGCILPSTECETVESSSSYKSTDLVCGTITKRNANLGQNHIAANNQNDPQDLKNHAIGKPVLSPSKNALSNKSSGESRETVVILRTTSPCKKAPPPPIPSKKSPSTGNSGPIVKISSYEEPKNRFLVQENAKSAILVAGEDQNNDPSQNLKLSNAITNNKDTGKENIHPISIKINVK